MEQLLATKLFIPHTRPELVPRPRLVDQLNRGVYRKLTLLSAPAGFGKTTLVSEWIDSIKDRPDNSLQIAWLSLDEKDNDFTRFLTYLIASIQTVAENVGKGVLGMLQSPQPPSSESILTILVNEIAAIPKKFVLILDDYHLIDAKPVDEALIFLIENLPPPMRLVIATREDPQLPLAKLRARDQLTELRSAHLRFTPAEAAEFLNQVMGLNLSPEDITLLETRTEGWIAGLQLAAISMRGQGDTPSFIKSFTGSHHFVMDYLVEEVLHQQTQSVQSFLLHTSILDRLCGSLCDAVTLDPTKSGQATLEYLEQANLFIVPLDNERRWYRYHHLFSELLRQKLHQSVNTAAGESIELIKELHTRASQWYEDHELEIDAFHHAVAVDDVERAERLIEGKGTLLHFRGVVRPLLNWLDSLPASVMDAYPSLWTTYASLLLVTGRAFDVEPQLQAAEAALQNAALDEKNRDIIGRIAAIRATVAASRNQVDTIITQSRRALEYLHPNNLSFRTFTTWKLGYAYFLQGDRKASSQAYSEAISAGKASGNFITTLMATIGLGCNLELENQLYQAAEIFQQILDLTGDQSLPVTCEALLGLARIHYEWNNLDATLGYLLQSAPLAQQSLKNDRVVIGEVLLARLKLALGDPLSASEILKKANQSALQHNFVQQIPQIAAMQVLAYICQGDMEAAAHVARMYNLPISQARVQMAQRNPQAALALLEPLRKEMESKAWADELLRIMVLQAVALQVNGEKDKAAQQLDEALSMAEPGGFVRLFIDEGAPMAELLRDAAVRGTMPNYVNKLQSAFETETVRIDQFVDLPALHPLLASLSPREMEILHLIAQGFSNREICERLYLALDTVKGHNRKIFGKLRVQRRTEAVARARELGLV